MRSIRTILVDDEWLIRSELTAMLRRYPEVEIVGEAANAMAALKMIAVLRPDLVFLDIQMPGLNGFQLLDELIVPIKVIFISAYHQHLEASKRYHPLGFLLKPIHPQKLDKVLEQLRQSICEVG
jgi:two-component system, LytTR family, response regulator